MRILVVEDDQLLNKTLSYNLSAVGYSVDGAMSKAVAIRFLEKQDYDLIVLDVNLPDGNGFDICREVKERRPDTAVIFLTANDMESDNHWLNRGYKFCKLCSYQYYYTQKRTCHASKYWYDRKAAKENAII
mgnify:CR=1 FL=1